MRTGVRQLIAVLLADDHSVVREGLQALLRAEPDLRVVGQAATGEEAVVLATRLKPDVVVMDIAMPAMNGLEAARRIRAQVPGPRILVLSAYSNPSCLEQVLALDVAGYLVKSASIHILARAIREVHAGKTFFDPSLGPVTRGGAGRKPDPPGAPDASVSVLSARETDVLRLIAEGLLNKQIAARLGISAKTSEKHRYNLMEKLKIHDTAGLTRYAVAAGLAPDRG